MNPKYCEGLPDGIKDFVYDTMKAANPNVEPDLARPTSVEPRDVKATGFIVPTKPDVAKVILN